VTRLGASDPSAAVRPAGVRVVLDLRPLQEPDRAPVTAAYLEELLTAFAAEPLPGESLTIVLQTGLFDPTDEFEPLDTLAVAGRRWLPPTKLLRSGALAVDPFLLRSASLGAAWRADAEGAAGAVYHAAAGAAPIMSRLPLVASLLDTAPWELPSAYQRTATARFGQRLRGRILQRASVIVAPSLAAASVARHALHVRRDRIRVVPLAARSAFAAGPARGEAGAAEERRLHDVPERYLVYTGRYDARQDVATLLAALRILAAEATPARTRAVPWPPVVLLVGATPDDRAAVARAAARQGVGELIRYTPRVAPATLAALVAGARAALVPALSDVAGLGALDALAVGTPVVGTTVGALPEIVGPAGILAVPRNPERVAAAIREVWTNEAAHRRLAAASAASPTRRRTWADVARETRAIYAEVGIAAKPART
jgi:glycosyltransferase involved in cell wall biosynthesis